MTPRRLLKLACPTACAVCLAAGYSMAGQGLALVLVALLWVAWLFAANVPLSIKLIASVGLAAAGLSVGASPLWMLPGATLALAGWDLAHWENSLAGDLPAEAKSRLEQKHFECLALALGPGLLAAVAGQFIRFQIPFGVLVAVALLALLGLDRIWNWAKA